MCAAGFRNTCLLFTKPRGVTLQKRMIFFGDVFRTFNVNNYLRENIKSVIT